MFKIVANDMPWENQICSRIRDPSVKIRFVPSIKPGPGDVCNLLFLAFFEENMEK